MRTSGFPCRFSGCERTFQVEDQTSMAALTAGSAARTAHEIDVHGYKHAVLADAPRRTTWSRPRPKTDTAT